VSHHLIELINIKLNENNSWQLEHVLPYVERSIALLLRHVVVDNVFENFYATKMHPLISHSTSILVIDRCLDNFKATEVHQIITQPVTLTNGEEGSIGKMKKILLNFTIFQKLYLFKHQ